MYKNCLYREEMSGDPSYGLRCVACADYFQNTNSVLNPYQRFDKEVCSPEYILVRQALDRREANVAKLLLEHRAKVLANKEANVNAKSHKDKSLLRCAIEMNDIEITKWSLLENADVETRSHDDLTPLHKAAQLGNTEIAEVLLDHGADMNSVCASTLATLLHTAVKEDKKALVELLLITGGNINATAKDEGTLLVLAAESNSLNVVKLLLNSGADIDARDKNNENIVDLAVKYDKLPLIELLLKAHSEPYTAIHGSVGETQSKILEALRRCGFGVHSEDLPNRYLLHNAITIGYSKIVEYLLNFGPNYNAELESLSKNGCTPLHTAAQYAQVEIAELLIKRKANVNAQLEYGQTPLYYAITCGMTFSLYSVINDIGTIVCPIIDDDTRIRGIVALLLDRGADVDARAKDGTTPLHVAVKKGYQKVIERLLDSDADVNAYTKIGATPLHLAALKEHHKVVELLLEHNAQVHSIHKGLRLSAVQIATTRKNVQMVQLLLDHDYDIDLCRNYDTTLHEWITLLEWVILQDSDRIGAILKQHVVKMITLNRYVNYNEIRVIKYSSEYKRLQDQCKGEIDCMRQKNIGVSNVSYYDVLTSGMDRLAFYARNKDIVDVLERGDHKDMFSVYSGMLNSRFKKAQKRAVYQMAKRGLLNSSLKSLRFLTEYALPYLAIIELSNYLTVKDLENLIKAGPNVESDN